MSQPKHGEQDETGTARIHTPEARAALRAFIQDGEWFGAIVRPGLTYAHLMMPPPETID